MLTTSQAGIVPKLCGSIFVLAAAGHGGCGCEKHRGLVSGVPHTRHTVAQFALW